MASNAGKIYVFDEFLLDAEARNLTRRNGRGSNSTGSIRLANRPFQVLLCLIENRHRIVTRRELLEKFWDGHDVYDEAVTKCISSIRKALNEPHNHGQEARFIETRWAGGYRFIGEVEMEASTETSIVGIEKVREVKIVVEETDDEATRSAGPTKPAVSEGLNWQKQGTAKVIAFAAAAVLVVAAATIVFLQLRNKPAPIRSVAVLPFKNLSSDPEGEIITDGMTESVISSLSRINDLKVVSRNSVSAFKGKDTDPEEIRKKLGVGAFLEGSVRANGERIRVDVRLVDAEKGEVLWNGGEYERPIGDVFEIQDDIARSVATRLRLELSKGDDQRLTEQQTQSVEAYQAYIKGRYFWKKKDRENLEKSRGYFEEAIRKDPNYALAYAGLAEYYLTGIWYANFEPGEATRNAKIAAAKVSQIDDRLPEAHALNALVAGNEWDWETNRRELERAVELNPNEADYWQSYAFVLRNFTGDIDEAVKAIKRAQDLDPLSPSINADTGVMLTHAGRYDEAVEAFRKTLEIAPQFFDAYWNLGLTYERQGHFDDAVNAFIESERLKGTSQERLAEYQSAFVRGGMRGFRQEWLDSLLADEREKKVPLYYIAEFYAYIGENDAAMEWLEKSYAAHEPHLVNLKVEFAFDRIRSDPRFGDLVRRVGLDK